MFHCRGLVIDEAGSYLLDTFEELDKAGVEAVESNGVGKVWHGRLLG
jgi:hypothetical protein